MSGCDTRGWPVAPARIDALWGAEVESAVWRNLDEKYRALAELAVRHRGMPHAPSPAEADDLAGTASVPVSLRDDFMSGIARRWPGALREAELVSPEHMARRSERVRELADLRPTTLAALVGPGGANDRHALAAVTMWSVHRMLCHRGKQARGQEATAEPSESGHPVDALGGFAPFATQVESLAQSPWRALLLPNASLAPIKSPSASAAIDETSDRRARRLSPSRCAHLVLAAGMGLPIRSLLLLGYEREGRWLAHPADPAWSHQSRGPAQWRLDGGPART